MNTIPKRLKQEPLIEAIWQVQFEPKPAMPVGDLLPGILYSSLKVAHPGLQIHRLPNADIPAAAAQLDPNLRFTAKYRIAEPGSPFLYQVGDRVVTVNCRKPYSGWDAFKEKILVLAKIAEDSGLVPIPTRHSLRYIDLLTLDPAPDLSALQLALKVGQREVHGLPLQMRMELPDSDFTHIVQVATPAEARLPEGMHKGSVIDLESFFTTAPQGWGEVRMQIDYLHDRSKAMFFQQLLTAEAIERMEPEY